MNLKDVIHKIEKVLFNPIGVSAQELTDLRDELKAHLAAVEAEIAAEAEKVETEVKSDV
jgi:hypothetical protein